MAINANKVASKISDIANEAGEVYKNTQASISRSLEQIMAEKGYRGGQVVRQIPLSFNSIFDLKISDFCSFNDRNYEYMEHHMLMNIHQLNTILNNTGYSASGNSSAIVTDKYYAPSYTEETNYVENFQKSVVADENEGRNTTRHRNQVPGTDMLGNYGNVNQLYSRTIDKFPDDNDTGSRNFHNNQKWNVTNKNSILYKTKELFRQKKINTIISRFHTENENAENSGDNKSVFGLSHGRNLLTYDAETKGNAYDSNGYENPYCRVWTHHWQYKEHLGNMIRPFSRRDDNGNIIADGTVRQNKWNNGLWGEKFVDSEGKEHDILTMQSTDTEYGDKAYEETWGWRDSGAELYKHSVLNHETGLLNITPKFRGGGVSNIHTKDCMFSIENLAWQGYDPYSFEKSLSWEQRGPFGGRIMWFPPYGLSFSEDSSVNWQEHSFIGRGENVFTYTNTSRSGTLSFMMVVDHPSIIDYATWYKTNGADMSHPGLTDTDILRFFAGCEGDGSNDLKDKAKPTPLTDEYLGNNSNVSLKAKEIIEEKAVPVQPEPDPNVDPDEPIEISFYAFYPNNYSGCYDRTTSSKVNPIAYLLGGYGAQWKCDDDDVTKSEVIPIDFVDATDEESILNSVGSGYETVIDTPLTFDQQEQDAEHNYIIGTRPNWNQYTSSVYVPHPEWNKWYYRTDGRYDVADGKKSPEKNTFDQTLGGSGNSRLEKYKDTASFGYNSSYDAISTLFKNGDKSFDSSELDNVYTLAEVAVALYSLKKSESFAQALCDKFQLDYGSERIQRLRELLNNTEENSVYRVEKIKAQGLSNSHGRINRRMVEARNNFLATERARTAAYWFQNLYSGGNIFDEYIDILPSQEVGSEDHSSPTAKKYRSAKITLVIRKNANVEPQDTEQEPEVTDIDKELAQIEEKLAGDITPEEREKLQKEKDTLLYKKEEKNFGSFKRFEGFKHVNKTDKGVHLYKLEVEQNGLKYMNKLWYYDEKDKTMKIYNPSEKDKGRFGVVKDENGKEIQVGTSEYNTMRYDQEYYFFKQLKLDHPMVFNTLVDKLQYFHPAYHSMTPEGFVGRLNFLHQCTRQGNTLSASDKNGANANNLAFGRPPFCILRLGDFYYQKIVIKNITINYDPLQLDLNPEGIGVVPLLANVQISFNFIGGSGINGPIRRLQNAQSFNFYAANQLFDNRADRVDWSQEFLDGKFVNNDTDKINWSTSVFYHTPQKK